MPPGAGAVGRAIGRAVARRAVQRAAIGRARAGRARGRGRGEADEARGRGRFGRGGAFSRVGGGEGAGPIEFDSAIRGGAQEGMKAMYEMAGNRGQFALLREVEPKYIKYADDLAESGSKPQWSEVKRMTDKPDAIGDILNEGFEHLVQSYKNDVETERELLDLEDDEEQMEEDNEDA